MLFFQVSALTEELAGLVAVAIGWARSTILKLHTNIEIFYWFIFVIVASSLKLEPIILMVAWAKQLQFPIKYASLSNFFEAINSIIAYVRKYNDQNQKCNSHE